jgi:hypothetical protein
MNNYALDLNYDDQNGFCLNVKNSISLIDKFAKDYINSEPFPHVVFDSFLPDNIANRILENFPKENLPNDINYKDGGIFEHNKRQILPYDCSKFAKEFFNFFNSAEFLQYLEAVTGIDGLISDPYFDGGGFHEISRGGKLAVHADFRIQKKLNLHRRLNLLIYLNKNWSKEYMGGLELWDQTMTSKVKTIYPDFNRCLIFSTDAESFHGHPDPLNIPEGMTRKSIALYYYTASKEIYNETKNVSTIFKARPEDSDSLKEAAKFQNEREFNKI